MNKFFIRMIVSLFSVFISTLSYAQPQSPSPVGSWQTYDLSGTPRSIVRFYISGNQLLGRIVKILPTKGQSPNDVCDKCPSPWTNKRKLGMVIIWGLTRDNNNMWKNGYILDTDSGKTYRVQVSVAPNNRTLNLHAYVGTPAFGRTVQWARVR